MAVTPTGISHNPAEFACLVGYVIEAVRAIVWAKLVAGDP